MVHVVKQPVPEPKNGCSRRLGKWTHRASDRTVHWVVPVFDISCESSGAWVVAELRGRKPWWDGLVGKLVHGALRDQRIRDQELVGNRCSRIPHGKRDEPLEAIAQEVLLELVEVF